MRKIVKISGPFECEFSDGTKVRFDLSYRSRQDPSYSTPLKFELEAEGPDPEGKNTLKGEAVIELGSHGYGSNDDFRRFMVFECRYGKKLEMNVKGYTFPASSQPSFYPTVSLKFTSVTPEGCLVELPSEALRTFQLEFSPLPPPREIDI